MKAAIFGTALAFLALPAWAQQDGPVPDPDWPCIQRRQPALSVGQIWSGPAPDAAAEEQAAQPAIRDLAQTLALRRTELPQAEAMIADFWTSNPDPVAMTGLFLATFEAVQLQRNRVLSGITRYAHHQEALDARIKDQRHQFATLTEAKQADFDAIDKLEAEIDWSTRIFQERQQSLTYVCETPVILEQRIFALGRAMAAHLPRP